MKILITGAGGFIGKNLALKLRDKHDIRCLVYDNEEQATNFFSRLGTEVIIGDVTDKGSLSGITEDIGVVFHLAAQRRGWSVSPDLSYQVNVLGTKNVVEESLAEPVDHFLHCSTSSIIGPVRDRPLDESYPDRDRSKLYYRTKLMGNKVVSSVSDRLNTTILLPSFVYGPHDDHHLRIFRAVKQNRLHFVGRADNKFQPTYIDDCLQAFTLAMQDKRAFGENFIVCADKVFTTEEIIFAIAQALNRDISPLHIPYLPAQVTSLLLEVIGSLAGFKPPLNQRVIDWFRENHFFDNSKIKETLGFKPQFDLKQGLEETANWYISHNWL